METWMILIVVAVVFGAVFVSRNGSKTVGGKTIDDLLAEPDVLLIDVRSPAEFATGHVPGAHNIALPQIEQVKTRFADLNRPTIVYCRSGARSGRARSLMTDMGYTQVANGGGVQSLASRMKVDLER